MSTSVHQRDREQQITHYLAVVRRYKWLILGTTLVVPLMAFIVSTQQTKVFRATSEVLLNRQDIGATITGIPTQGSANDDPTRYARTQAQLARVPSVRQATVDKAGVDDVDAKQLADIATVTENKDSDILTFAIDHSDPSVAERLATAYARAFTAYKLESDTASLAQARAEIQGRLNELRSAGAAGTDTYRVLLGQAQNLRTLELLLAPARVVRTADEAEQIAPTPFRNAVLGAVIGLLLGVGAVFGLNAVDRRIRHADEVEYGLQIPLLAKLPTPRRGDTATILERPPDETTEAIALLRANFDFTNTDVGARLVMITSAGPREGKSTTIANLAIALARTGRHVVLVDLDLRRPAVSRLLHLPEGPGITDLASRNVGLADTLQPVSVTTPRPRVSSVGGTDTGHGRLEVITVGRTRVEPAAFVESSGLTEALQNLRAYAEVVLIDAPPLLATGDALALTGKIDALLLVSRLGTLTRPALQELNRVLRRSPAPVLGLVATGAETDGGYAAYSVSEYFAHERTPDRTVPRPVAEVRSASAGGTGRWTPRRGG